MAQSTASKNYNLTFVRPVFGIRMILSAYEVELHAYLLGVNDELMKSLYLPLRLYAEIETETETETAHLHVLFQVQKVLFDFQTCVWL